MFASIGLWLAKKAIFGQIGSVFKAIPRWVWIVLGIVLALLLAWHVHTGWEKSAHASAVAEGVAAEKINTDAEIAKNAIQRVTIDNLIDQIGKQNAAIDALNADSNARVKAGADALAAAKQGRAATESAVAALQASAVRNIAPGAPCASSAAIRAHGKEL